MTVAADRAQFADHVRAETVFLHALLEASRPRETLTVSEWADRYRVVSEESGSPWPGPFRTQRVPYIREVQDCLHPDHPSRRYTARWAAQLGKSTVMENWFGFIVDQAPGSMMITLPTLEEALKFNRIKLQPTISASPRLRHKIAPVNVREEQGSTTSFKKFAGGFAQIVNAGSSKGLQMVSIRYLGMDEVSGYPKDVDGRGSPRDQARARQKMYGDEAKEFQCSTPGIARECAITEDYEAGDRRLFYVSCPHCRWYQPLVFGQMADGADDEGSHFVCFHCQGKIFNSHKHDLLSSGEWIATIPLEDGSEVPECFAPDALDLYRCAPCEGRCRNHQPSSHLWAAYAPKETFDAIRDRWHRAQGDTTRLRTFYQQDMAEPYEPAVPVVKHERIVDAARAAAIPAAIVPQQAGILVSAADVQGYGIKWAVYALGASNQYWVIDRDVFSGDPAQSDEPWLALADCLGRRYPTATGREVSLTLSGIDSGYATQRVYRFCASRPDVIALDGRADARASWIGSPTAQKIRDANRSILARINLYPVYLYDIKTAVGSAIANLVDGPSASGGWPRNCLHIASDLCDGDFARELTAEVLVDPDEEVRSSVNRRARHLVSPRARREWKKIAGRDNDWWDITVYAFALCWLVEARRRMTPEKWQALLLEVHGEDVADDLFTLAQTSPFEDRAQSQDNRAFIRRISERLNR